MTGFDDFSVAFFFIRPEDFGGGEHEIFEFFEFRVSEKCYGVKNGFLVRGRHDSAENDGLDRDDLGGVFHEPVVKHVIVCRVADSAADIADRQGDGGHGGNEVVGADDLGYDG